ncbi:hypothetical protein AGMMS50222_04940 [Endomicrobiia bacterium]|nr:hypothetical protein AGMMS49556_03470 [Endomicrobiia bacterium]GHT70048.1 hypothetical protein AGMMS49950_04120 [Endomicrobiia bacterium]GHT74923.1 hypothetical protein AGMMS50222_04940 [Endomicrobiia bacterium]
MIKQRIAGSKKRKEGRQVSKEKIEYREYCKDDVLNTLGQYPNILSQETATMSAKVVDIDIGY